MTGKKMAKDPAYRLACNLLAAQLNFAAGAQTCQEALDAALDTETILIDLGFDGTGNYLSSEDPDYHTVADLAEILDQYNNGMLCNTAASTRSRESTSSSAILGLIGLNISSGLSNVDIFLNAPFGMNPHFYPTSVGIDNTYSGAFAMNTVFSPPFGLALGQSAGFSPPFGTGSSYNGPFSMNNGFLPPFSVANGPSVNFKKNKGFFFRI